MSCRLLNNIYGGTCIADRVETTLNIVLSRVTFHLFSSVGHFKSFRIIMTVLGVDLYSFITIDVPLVSTHSQCPLSVFECAGHMYNIHTQAVV